MNENTKEAIILLGHGSRVPGAGEGMELVAQGMRQKMGPEIIEICYMSKLGPHFPEAFDACVARGAKKVVVMPYFLHSGLHMREDIPEILRGKGPGASRRGSDSWARTSASTNASSIWSSSGWPNRGIFPASGNRNR